jgi:hypothetical protein
MPEICSALIYEEMRTEDEKREGVFEVIPYYTCDLIDEHNFKCPYPARFCEYKEQNEKFEQYLLNAIEEALGDE